MIFVGKLPKVVTFLSLLILIAGYGLTQNSKAAATIDKTAEVVYVKSQTMGNIKLRIWRAKPRTDKTVILLDGMRARNDYSGWEIFTNVHKTFNKAGINVVEPIGGAASFYADWIRPSGTNHQRFRYTWDTFLTKNMPIALNKIGLPAKNLGVVGISMAASSALALAAYHPNIYNYAGSISGYLSLNAPGIPLAIRLSMLDAGGYNVDDMWGPPWGAGWYRNDPMVFIDRLIKYNKRIWIGTGNGLPGKHETPSDPNISGMGLEAMAVFTARLFQIEALAKGYRNAMFDYTPTGVHNWPYWIEQIQKMIPDMTNFIGGHPLRV